jgi:hypothetical protein
MSSAVDIGKVTVDDFEPRLKETFRLQLAGASCRWSSMKCSGSRAPSAPAVAFHWCSSPRGGPFSGSPCIRFSMFLVPLGPAEAGNAYQAIFA